MGWKHYCSENEFLSFEVVLLFALMFLVPQYFVADLLCYIRWSAFFSLFCWTLHGFKFVAL